MALTGRQIRRLRSLAHHLNPIINIGRADITDSVVKQTDEALEARELVKCSVQDGSDLSCAEAAQLLAERCRAEVVQVIGRKFTIYRESGREDIDKIELA